MEKREIALTVSLIMDGKQQMRFDLRPGEQWKGGTPGSYRLYRDRCVPVDGPDGEPLFVTLDRAFALMAGMLCGGVHAAPPCPDLPTGTGVSVPNGRMLGDMALRDVTRTTTPPILGHDGRWHVGVLMWGCGTRFVPVDDLIRK